MRILLPPSEGKTSPITGPPLDLAALCLPELTDARQRILDTLTALCDQADPEPARAVLGLSPGQLGEIRRNAQLRTAPTAPAAQVYTGVLYEALGLHTLNAPARALAQQSVLIFSGLWGVLRVTDHIPAYRCSITVRPPGVGALTGHWRAALAMALPSILDTGLLLDLRSTAYAAMWSPKGDLADRTVQVRILHEQQEHAVPRRTVVSHANKAVKGRLIRDLFDAGIQPESPAELVTALRDLKYTVEEVPGRSGAARRLDVVVSAL